VLEKRYVFVVDKNNVVHSREISIDSEMPDLYVVKKGVTEKERILLEGIRKVKDQDHITYTYQRPTDVLKNLKVYVE